MGHQLASDPEVMKISNLKDSKYLRGLEKFSRATASRFRVGKEFGEPIVCCLRGFEDMFSRRRKRSKEAVSRNDFFGFDQ